MTTVEDIQKQIDEYAEQITGITIDRGFGEGEEYFKITGYTIDNNSEIVLIYEDGVDLIDAKFLSTCSYVKFYLADEVVIKEDEDSIYTLQFTKKELSEIVRALLNVHDRLVEVKGQPSILSMDVSILPNKVTNIHELIKARAERKGEK